MNGNNEEIVRKYFQTIADGLPAEDLEILLHPDIVQQEFPSRLNLNGRTRNGKEMLSDFEKGKLLLSKQEYAIKSILSDGDRVGVETGWTGTLAVPLGSLKAGDRMKADFGVFFRIKDGRIIEQRNYDCIHPW